MQLLPGEVYKNLSKLEMLLQESRNKSSQEKLAYNSNNNSFNWRKWLTI